MLPETEKIHDIVKNKKDHKADNQDQYPVEVDILGIRIPAFYIGFMPPVKFNSQQCIGSKLKCKKNEYSQHVNIKQVPE